MDKAALLGQAWHLASMFHRPIRKVLSKETISYLFLKSQKSANFQDGQGHTLNWYTVQQKRNIVYNRVFGYVRLSGMASKLIYAKDVCLVCERGYEFKPSLYYCIYGDLFYKLANRYRSCFFKKHSPGFIMIWDTR